MENEKVKSCMIDLVNIGLCQILESFSVSLFESEKEVLKSSKVILKRLFDQLNK